MKTLQIITLLIGFIALAQTPTSTQKGYYLQKIGDSVVGQNSRPDKAFFDLFNYMKERKIKNGTVTSPFWEITIDYSDTVNNDTIIINNGDISVGNQWMGEPIKVSKDPIYGVTIYDRMTTHYVPQNAFDRNPLTFFHGYNINFSWIGQDYEKQVTINRFRFLPSTKYEQALLMNGALIQYSDNGTNWTTIHTIYGINETNFTQWVDVTFEPVTARYFRLYATKQGSYCITRELEFHPN